LKSILIFSSHLCLGLSCDLFPSDLLTKTLYAPLLFLVHATCPTLFILIDLITWKTWQTVDSWQVSSPSWCILLTLLQRKYIS
jgi:hypothetical protein